MCSKIWSVILNKIECYRRALISLVHVIGGSVAFTLFGFALGE